MSVLSKTDILEAMENSLGIEPFSLDRVQPASVDLRLGSDFKQVSSHWIDPRNEVEYEERELKRLSCGTDILFLHPGEFVLGTTVEKVTIPLHLVARVEGKSSLGRIGIAVHITAGYVDPGFSGQITLEIKNNTSKVVYLYPGMDICQLAFEEVKTPCEEGYTGRYQDQEGTTGSKVHEQTQEN